MSQQTCRSEQTSRSVNVPSKLFSLIDNDGETGISESGFHVVLPRMYANVVLNMKNDYSDYENHLITWGVTDSYEIVSRYGRGKYSEVFGGVKVSGDITTPIVLKCLKPVRKKKVKREIKILQQLRGGPSIIELIDTVRDQVSRTPTLVMGHMEFLESKALNTLMTPFDHRVYIFHVLLALHYAHSQGIMHRDVKPGNIVYSKETQKLRLIDWGLAEYYKPRAEYNVRVASKYYKAPELLLNYRCYDYGLDIWALGCCVAGMIFNRDPFFQGEDSTEMITEIAKCLGSKSLLAMCKKFGIPVDVSKKEAIGNYARVGFSANNDNPYQLRDICDLVARMLIADHSKRLCAIECLYHPAMSVVWDWYELNCNFQRFDEGVLQKVYEANVMRENKDIIFKMPGSRPMHLERTEIETIRQKKEEPTLLERTTSRRVVP